MSESAGTEEPQGGPISSLLADFEAGVIPRDQWNHRAHLTMALWYILDYGPDQGAARIREGILRYNKAQNIEQTPTGGYHETVTRFYIWLVQRFVLTSDTARPRLELLEDLCRRYGDPDYPLRYYSKERLFSWEARTGWVPPDLRPMGAHV
jgi:hypothetical protein